MLATAIVMLSAVLAGFALGYILGFAMASHNDVAAGVQPRTNNKVVLFLARPTSNFSFGEKILFALVMILWLPLFFGLVAIPAIVGEALKLDDDVTIKATYGVLIVVVLIARKLGARAWNALV